MTAIEAGVLSAKARDERGTKGLGRKAKRAVRKAAKKTGRDTVLSQMIDRRSFRGPFKRTLTANIDGSPIFHVISGNLGYQVEHHLFPDMPSTRYGEIAPKVREICERYELPYNAGPFGQQLGMVQRTILRLAFPGGKARPKPGPYHGPRYRGEGEKGASDLNKAA